MQLARTNWQSLFQIRSIVNESHFLVSIRRCGACGQRFVSVFAERIDWIHGNDPQDSLLIPVAEAEADALVAAGIGVETALKRISPRRHLWWRWPSDATASEISDQTGSIFVPPHD